MCHSSYSSFRQLSFDDCRSFLQSKFSAQSWTSVRHDTFLHLNFDHLPSEMWGVVLGFLTNDSSSLLETILVPDLRSGFYFPGSICQFSSREIHLLSMIPWIEGLVRQDQWTRERCYRLGLCNLLFDEYITRNWNLDDSSERDFDSSSIPLLKWTKIT